MAIESLSRKSCLPIWIFAFALLAPPPAWARLSGGIPNIRTITNDSNLIAVVEVVNMRTPEGVNEFETGGGIV